MSNYSVEAAGLGKSFGRRQIFSNLNFLFNKPGIYGISGPNGSGKSTLVKIIAGLLGASQGAINHNLNNKNIVSEDLHNYIGFVSPYLVLYEEFTTLENLKLIADIRGISFNSQMVDYLLNKFILFKRKDDLVKTYSSGMKQRVKFIFALMHSPPLIILDEPTSNLDEEGKNSVYQIVKEESENKIVLIASNEKNDLDLCNEILYLENFKSNKN